MVLTNSACRDSSRGNLLLHQVSRLQHTLDVGYGVARQRKFVGSNGKEGIVILNLHQVIHKYHTENDIGLFKKLNCSLLSQFVSF